MKKNIILCFAVCGIFLLTSCAKNELSEIRLSDEKAIEMTNAVLCSVRNSFYEGIAKVDPGKSSYNGIDFNLEKGSNDVYTIEFDKFSAIIDGKAIFIKDGSADFKLSDVSLFTGKFEIGKLEFVYDKLERDFSWDFSNEGLNYVGEIEIEDHHYSCVKKLFPLKKENQTYSILD